MARSHRLGVFLLLGGLLASPVVSGASGPDAPAPETARRAVAPLSGRLVANGKPVARAAILVRRLSDGVGAALHQLTTERDGSFVWADAPAGLYAIVAVLPGFRPALQRVWHDPRQEGLTHVKLDLEAEAGVLPQSRVVEGDPWLARAVVSGDVLRDAAPVAVVESGVGSSPIEAGSNVAATVPVRASLRSTTGLGASDEKRLTRTEVDLSGSFGTEMSWGVEGRYSRLTAPEGRKAADASELAVAFVPARDQAIRISTRRQLLPGDGPAEPRFSAHSLDWSGPVSERSRASVSARLTSQANVLQSGLAREHFSRASSALEVSALYRTDFSDGGGVRLALGYRSDSAGDTLDTSRPGLREARVGAGAGFRVADWLLVEAGASGDYSARLQGVTPELTLTIHAQDGLEVFGAVSRRFEHRTLDAAGLVEPGGLLSVRDPLGAGDPESGSFGRLARGTLRGGLRYRGTKGESFVLEASQRELADTLRYLLDPDFVDNLDSLYFFSGDRVREVGGSASFRVLQGVAARVTARGGTVDGDGDGSIQGNSASYSLGEAALLVAATRTEIGVGYRSVRQALHRGATPLRNDVEAVEMSLSQAIPWTALGRLGSGCRALISFEIGTRQEGDREQQHNRRLAGGLGLSF